MRFLVVYGTGEGQTKKIAEFVASRLDGGGHQSELRDSRRRMADVDIGSFDAVIVAGSVHLKRHPEPVENFLVAHRDELAALPTALISVSLSIAFEGGEEEARNYVRQLVDATGFEPGTVLLVAGALRFAEYDYFMDQVVQHVVLESQGPIDEDREFTDWDKLAGELDAFVGTVG